MKPGETYTTIQPRDGDMVMFCPHIEVHPNLIDFHGCHTHWIAFESPAKMEAENIADGRRQIIWARFICLCDDCFKQDPEGYSTVAQHGRWIGNEPIIVQEAVS